jgi:hypothetical protein
MAGSRPSYMERMQAMAAEAGRELARQAPLSGERTVRTKRLARQIKSYLPDGREIVTEEVLIIEETENWEGWQ